MNIRDINVAVLRMTKLNLFLISGDKNYIFDFLGRPQNSFLISGDADVPRTVFFISGEVPRVN